MFLKFLKSPGDMLTGGQSDNPTDKLDSGVNQTPPAQEPTFTKSQVSEMMKKRVARSHNAFFTRYGVKSLEELDGLVGKSRSYDVTKQLHDELETRYSDLETKYKDTSKKYAFKMGNIDEARIADIEAYFKGKGIDIDESTLMQEIQMHPEWVMKANTIQTLGQTPSPLPGPSEKEIASQIFGVKIR